MTNPSPTHPRKASKMKREVLNAVSIRGSLALAWMAVFVAAMSLMMAYVIEPALDARMSDIRLLLADGPLSAFAVIAGLMLLACFVLSYQLASVIVGHLFGRPTIRLED